MAGTGTRPRTRAGVVAPALVPLLFLVPVAATIVLSLARLVQVRYPAYGWTMNIDADAQALAFGISPFQDPAHGYTGSAYTPLFPFLASLADHVYRWTGWSVLITILAAAGSAALVARFAWRPALGPGRRWQALALAEAGGIGALAWSLAYDLEHSEFFNGKNDQLACLFSLGAIALVPAVVRGRTAARVGSVLLVSAAFWTKQIAIIAAVSVGAALLVAVVQQRMRARAVVAMALAALVLNLLALAVLDVATHGWLMRWVFDIRLPVTRTAGYGLGVVARNVGLALVMTAAMVALARAARRRGAAVGGAPFLATDRGLLVVALATLAALGAAEGVYLLRFPGGADNDLLACAWALGALVGVCYALAAACERTRGRAALVCVFAAVTTLAGTAGWNLRRGSLVP